MFGAVPLTKLGRSGLEVSNLALGTVALGSNYGLPGSREASRPRFESAVEIVRHALDRGINFFDTAPAYGDAEEILGVAIGSAPDVVICSKVGTGMYDDTANAVQVAGSMRRSVETSLRQLRRPKLDVLKLHSATERDLRDERILRGFETLRVEGLVGATGASVYGEASALTAIATGAFDVLQVAFNLLDQRPLKQVFHEAERRGVAIVVRSAFLKGALTGRWRSLPHELQGLREAVRRLVDGLSVDDADLPAMALRYCLSHRPSVCSVLVGATAVTEIDDAVDAIKDGSLSPTILSKIADCAVVDEHVIDPSIWPRDDALEARTDTQA